MKYWYKFICFIFAIALFMPSSVVDATEKRIVTQQEYKEEFEKAQTYKEPMSYPQRKDYSSEEEFKKAEDKWEKDWDDYNLNCEKYTKQGQILLYKKILTYDGAYQENGAKIYTVMNAKTKTFKKTGKYSIIVGGTTVKKNEGTVKFVAPETGKYRISLDTRETVVSNESGLTIRPDSNAGFFQPRLLYCIDGTYERNPNTSDILIGPNETGWYSQGGFIDYTSHGKYSEMQACVGWMKMKKGQYVKFRCRSSAAGLKNEYAYDVAGFDLTITKEGIK